MEYVHVTKDNLEEEHICCAISNNKDVQVSTKKAWLSERFDEGLVFLKSVERGKCFIEYIPAENAWNPIDADGYLYLRGRSKCMILGPSGQNIYPEEIEAIINNASYVVESLVIEDGGGLTALIYPDYQQGQNDGMDREQLEQRLVESLPEFNKLLPAYAQLKKIEVMPEDFERTPKKSIKRYLYQR